MISADNLAPAILGAGTVPERGRRKLAALDGIRGAAVLAVMFSHFNRFLPATAALAPLKGVFDYGGAGVDLFFVLSGFLITGILMETKTAVNCLQSFYARRFLRIFPIYYAALIAVFIVAALVPSIQNVPPVGQRWLYFVYLTNWIPLWTGTWPPNVVGHFWSLAVEEQFYFVWPLCVLVLTQRGVFRVAAGLSIFALILRCVWVAHSGPNEAIALGTPTRMDALLIGAVAAVIFARGAAAMPKRLTAIGIVALGAALIGIAISEFYGAHGYVSPFAETAGYSLVAIGFGALVLGAAFGDGTGGPVQKVFGNHTLMRVGKYSYGMYVYHVPLLGICELLVYRHLPAWLTGNGWFGLLYVSFLAVATFWIAAFSFELFERPILALKRRFEPMFRIDDPAISRT